MSKMRNKRQLMELALVVLMASLMGAIGLLGFLGCFLGVEISDMNRNHVIGITIGLSGQIAGILVLSLRNRCVG